MVAARGFATEIDVREWIPYEGAAATVGCKRSGTRQESSWQTSVWRHARERSTFGRTDCSNERLLVEQTQV
jgi:hypothetical protein